MSLLAKFCFSCLVVSSLATYCSDSQHCSHCNNTGHCITDCDPGFYDNKCMSNCSKNCRNKTCSNSNIGSDNCTYGCVPGFQGTSCNIPCDSPGGNCTACPGGCDGGYCQLGSSCVSGCVDSYYGTDCSHSTYLNTAVVALSLFFVFFTFTILVGIVLKCWHIKQEGSREQVEEEYHHIQFQRGSSPDTVRHTTEAYAEVDDNVAGGVVVFL
ncbi:scavenger receptor class F member 1-like isoform X2 [Haliotis rubra]|uniref:scavenger receptor class F member 1-like isoform X2 n=1 Tax=Haliotis rubra TaxID=36100 RepID=UPI001EE5E0B6|nr:scavenger receptor class F member 1-like isoform X2 [Haliotis rubra]